MDCRGSSFRLRNIRGSVCAPGIHNEDLALQPAQALQTGQQIDFFVVGEIMTVTGGC